MDTLGTGVRRIVAHAEALAKTLWQQVEYSGQRLTARYMTQLNEWVGAEFGRGCVEPKLCGTRQSVDFFVRTEQAVIEVELSLSRSHNNFERDVFKALLAKDHGVDISTLLLLGDQGSAARHSEPASRAVIAWVQKHYGLRVIVHDLAPAA